MPLGKPLRSQPARDRILAGARVVFAKEGYERATIRAVAAAASVNPAIVIRYYGSKEALFAAAASFDLGLPDLSSAPREVFGQQLVAHFLSRWEDNARVGELAVLLRASASHEAARDALRKIFETQLMQAVKQLCGPKHAAQRAALIASQMLGLAYTRYVLGFPASTALSRELIVREIGGTIQAYLSSPMS